MEGRPPNCSKASGIATGLLDPFGSSVCRSLSSELLVSAPRFFACQDCVAEFTDPTLLANTLYASGLGALRKLGSVTELLGKLLCLSAGSLNEPGPVLLRSPFAVLSSTPPI